MVDEALIAYFLQKVEPYDNDKADLEDRLREDLLAYDQQGKIENLDDHLIHENEIQPMIAAINDLKIIDPAVGSGAFPMGILNKLVLILRKLDPQNQHWKQQQLAHTKKIDDPESKESAQKAIEQVFSKANRYNDYGRKLYLIQNCIYGVDIQPIAITIAKLRFFISLIIEQGTNENPDANYGIRPLPNLETKFVAANTLIGLKELNESEFQLFLENEDIQQLRQEIAALRSKHFGANTRQTKFGYMRREKACREQLTEALAAKHATWREQQQNRIEQMVADIPSERAQQQLRETLQREYTINEAKLAAGLAEANRIADWDAYDQNAVADWFDSEWMFGFTEGFDVVIGNPPYKQVRKGIHSPIKFPYSEGKDKGKQNFYKLFVEQSYNLCKVNGLATLIVQSSLMCDLSSSYTRELLLSHTQLKHIIEFPKQAQSKEAQVFNSVIQGTCIYQFTKAIPDNQPIKISVGNDSHSISNLNFVPITKKTIHCLYPTLFYFPHIKKGNGSILEKIASNEKIKPLRDYAVNIVQGDLNLTTHASRFSDTPTSVLLLRGKHVGRFVVKYTDAVEYCDEGFLSEKINENQDNIFLISQEVTGTVDPRRLHFALTINPSINFLWGHTVNKTLLKNQTNSKAYLALLNSKFMDWFFRITSTNNHVQGYELKQLPIPLISEGDLNRLDKLATQVMEVKAADPNKDIPVLEKKIDKLVYVLYDLTDDEIALIEQTYRDAGMEA